MSDRLLFLRELIYDTAARIEGVGPLEEALKWGQPSFLTSESKSGSLIRVDQKSKTLDEYAVYFHCQTNLVETFRRLYSRSLGFEGNRAIVFHLDDEVPVRDLRRCIAMALTYRMR